MKPVVWQPVRAHPGDTIMFRLRPCCCDAMTGCELMKIPIQKVADSDIIVRSSHSGWSGQNTSCPLCLFATYFNFSLIETLPTWRMAFLTSCTIKKAGRYDQETSSHTSPDMNGNLLICNLGAIRRSECTRFPLRA